MNYRQLPLQLRWADGYAFDNYVAGPSAALVQELQRCTVAPGHAAVYLWGGEGVGKSHLLQAACTVVARQQRSAAYLPLADELVERDPELLTGLEAVDLIAIDDLQAVAGNRGWEAALFHLYNRARDARSDSSATSPVRSCPSLSAITWALLVSNPIVEKPARANASARGRPT